MWFIEPPYKNLSNVKINIFYCINMCSPKPSLGCYSLVILTDKAQEKIACPCSSHSAMGAKVTQSDLHCQHL